VAASGEGWFYDAAVHVQLDVDLETGDITGALSGKLGEPIVLQGDMAGYRAKMKLTISLVP